MCGTSPFVPGVCGRTMRSCGTPRVFHCSFNRGCSRGEVGSNFHMARAGGWNNLANETNVSRTRARPPGSKSLGRVRHERGSIWVFKGHAKFYFRIRAARLSFRVLRSVSNGEDGGGKKREIGKRDRKRKLKTKSFVVMPEKFPNELYILSIMYRRIDGAHWSKNPT